MLHAFTYSLMSEMANTVRVQRCWHFRFFLYLTVNLGLSWSEDLLLPRSRSINLLLPRSRSINLLLTRFCIDLIKARFWPGCGLFFVPNRSLSLQAGVLVSIADPFPVYLHHDPLLRWSHLVLLSEKHLNLKTTDKEVG